MNSGVCVIYSGRAKGGREAEWKGGKSQARIGPGKIKPKPNRGRSLDSCPTLKQGGGAFKLPVQSVIGFVVMMVGGACQVVVFRPEHSSGEASVGCTGRKGDWAGRQQCLPQQVYLQHRLGGGPAGAKH